MLSYGKNQGMSSKDENLEDDSGTSVVVSVVKPTLKNP